MTGGVSVIYRVSMLNAAPDAQMTPATTRVNGQPIHETNLPVNTAGSKQMTDNTKQQEGQEFAFSGDLHDTTAWAEQMRREGYTVDCDKEPGMDGLFQAVAYQP